MLRHRRNGHILKERRERKYRLRARGSKFIPNSDSDFAQMARCFAIHVVRNNDRFGLPLEQVEKMTAAVEAYRQALHKTLTPRTCGPMATQIKNAARAEAEKIIRAVANVLRASEALTDDHRVALNIPKRSKRLQRRSCPDVAPVLTFKGSTDPYGSAARGAAKHILEYGNDFDNFSNAKPRGAVRLELFVGLVPPEWAAARKIPVHPDQLGGGPLWYVRSFTTSRFEVEFPRMADGSSMLVVYWGRWADARGGVGPFSKTCVARVEGDQLALPGAQRMPVFDERHRRKNVVGHLPEWSNGKYAVYQEVHILPPQSMEDAAKSLLLEADAADVAIARRR